MRNSGVVGIGCFAKPETLARVLRKMVERFISGHFDGLVQDNGKKYIQSELDVQRWTFDVRCPICELPYVS